MLTPRSEDELAEIVKDTSMPFRIQGGGTRTVGQRGGGEVLSTKAISGIEMYDPGALTLVVKAGTPLADVQEQLKAEGQRLAFEPMDHRGLLGTEGVPSIGGMVAGNVSGPRRIQCGACRDYLLGVRFVDGRGQVIKNGGRVMKNVTGYDLVKLMAGSYGTLGVLTEVSLKVLPESQNTSVLLLEGLDDASAITALCRALGSPYEVSGAAHVQKGLDGKPVTMVRIEGFEKSVKYRAAQLQNLLKDFGAFGVETDADRTMAGWEWVRDVAPFHGQPGDVWRLSVKPTDAPGVVAALDGVDALFDWGGGLIWLLDRESRNGALIRQKVSETGGHATMVRGNGRGSAFQPLPGPVAALQEGLRRKFDPNGLFNPGLMTPEEAA